SPKSRRWGEHRKRLHRPTAQDNLYRQPQGPHTPHRGSRRLAAWLPRLPLKGGVMGKMREWQIRERRFAALRLGNGLRPHIWHCGGWDWPLECRYG
ncbi:MAG: hypothetical protein OXU61_13800, partial [Gammaproteobacteria bacterium]|nr:hypothetical protein [Gammaproteobacteria bacterium]